MSGFDFLEEAEDSTGAPEAESQTPEELEEVVADDDSEEGAQDEPAVADGDADNEDEDEELEAFELDGEMITLDEVRSMRKAGMREQDYTKKTQALAESRKQFEGKLSEADSMIASLASIEDDIKSLLVADLEEIDLKSLRETDYVEYRKIIEEKEERQGKLDALKKKAEESKKAIIQERSSELNSLMGWDDQSKRTADVELVNSFIVESGFSKDDIESMTSPKVMASIIELAKLKQAQKAPKAKPKKVKISKRSSSKPTVKKVETLEDELDNFFK